MKTPEERAEEVVTELIPKAWAFAEFGDEERPEMIRLIAEAIRAAVEEERAACLKEAEDRIEFYGHNWRMRCVAEAITQAIRERATLPAEASPCPTSSRDTSPAGR